MARILRMFLPLLYDGGDCLFELGLHTSFFICRQALLKSLFGFSHFCFIYFTGKQREIHYKVLHGLDSLVKVQDTVHA